MGQAMRAGQGYQGDVAGDGVRMMVRRGWAGRDCDVYMCQGVSG